MVGSRILRVNAWGALLIALVIPFVLNFLWRYAENAGYREESLRQQAQRQALEMVNGEGTAICFNGREGYYRCKVLRRPLPPVTFFCTHEVCWAP